MHEDGVTLILKMDYETRDFLLQVNPGVYYVTDHYRSYPYVLLRLSEIDPKELQKRLEHAWKSCAPKRLAEAYDQGSDT